MVDLGFYERVLPVRSRGRTLLNRILIITAYILSLLIWIGAAYRSELSPAIILVVALAISAVAFFVFRRNDAEYEYSISESEATLAKIYGKSKRREIFSAEAKSILLIAPYNEDSLKKAEEYHPAETYSVYSAEAEENVWLMVFENEEEDNILFIFEANEEATRLLRKLKPSAMTFR